VVAKATLTLTAEKKPLGLLQRMIGGMVANVTRRRPAAVLLSRDRRYSRFKIGDWSYGEPQVVFWDAGATLTIGRFCSVAAGVTILLGGEHHPEWVTTYPFSLMFREASVLPGYPHTKGDVTVGNDVWIGRDALILSGVTIGDGAVIGAGSVVTKDVPPYSICAGNPARLVRFRFPPGTIEALLRIAWWNWPPETLSAAAPLLQSGDVEAFIAKYGEPGEASGCG
jgi:acetyltransferase-like isoleucine patch superfamily enzyme